MSNTARIAATAANTLTKPLNVEEVFSTYLLDGSGTITNGIDLAGEGGLLWTKWRSGGALSFYQNHFLYDTERGYGSTDYLHSNNTDAAGATGAIGSGSFNSDGFTTGGNVFSGNEWASWTFRKAPKFFDVVTYTGNGTAGRTVSHNLGSVPGCIIVKCTSAGANWVVYHRGTDATAPEDYGTKLSGTFAREDNVVFWNDTAPTSTEFTVGTGSLVNSNGATYVAYLFAHNNGDGDFGPTGDQDIIKCGSYTGNGSTNGPEIDLGFEPQFVIVKNATAVSDWRIFDTMRGWHVANGSNDQLLSANLTSAESGGGFSAPNATGFKIDSTGSNYNTSGNTYIYIAIRRGPMAVPTDATDVFAIDTQSGGGEPSFTSGFVVDMGIESLVSSASNRRISSRLTQGKALETNTTDADLSSTGYAFDYQNGWFYDGGSNADKYSWMWKRAPNYFDVVAYTGNSTAGRTVSHNLGVAPEMMWVKNRSSGVQHWRVYHSGLGATKSLDLNQSVAAYTSTINWNDTEPTSSVFSVGTSGATNDSGSEMIAYLFASLPGVSKVGSYTGTGTAGLEVDCGFTTGARFFFVKRVAGAGSWYVWDSARGITAGDDPYLALDSTAAEFAVDIVDPFNAGFIMNSTSTVLNASGETYIFYAIA